MHVAFVYDSKSDYLRDGFPADGLEEFDEDSTIDAITRNLEILGHRVTRVGNIYDLVPLLASGKYKEWDLVFNIAEGYYGSARESQVPGLLEAYNLPYTFSDANTIATCHDKGKTKILLQHHGIPTAPFTIVNGREPFKSPSMQEWRAILNQGPTECEVFTEQQPALFVKPAFEGSSKGIYDYCKAKSPEELNTAIIKLRERFPGQHLLVETFLDGREFSVAIVGTGANARVLAVTEFVWVKRGSVDFFTYDVKTHLYQDFTAEIEAPADDPEVEKVRAIGLAAWRVFDCRDCGRIDIRSRGWGLDAEPCVIEINPLAGLNPGYSTLMVAIERNGIGYDELLGMILASAMERETPSCVRERIAAVVE